MSDDIGRRSFLFGAISGLSIGLLPTVFSSTESETENDHPMPSSEVLDMNTSYYDERANMCALDLRIEVAPDERVLIHDDLGGSDRMVKNTGERILRAVVPADSNVLIYAVRLDSNTSMELETYRLSECGISEDEP